MSETITEKATCEKCGADVREGTTFCYSCGTKVPLSVDTDKSNETIVSENPVSEDLAEPVKPEEGDSDKLAKAADERKKARVGLRKTKEYAWEPVDDSRLVLLFAVAIGVIALGIVFLMVFWK